MVIESPYTGDVARNVAYAREALRDSLLRGEAPFASHLLYTQPGVLRDEDKTERALGIAAGLDWGDGADLVAVYADLGFSSGMREGVDRAHVRGTPVEVRYIRRGEATTASKADSMSLPTDSKARKDTPIMSGCIDYFEAALAEVARVSKAGNDKHNPGQPMHWARGKSSDHADCLLRHLIDRGRCDPDDGMLHTAKVAWRALALLQLELEARGAPLSRASRVAAVDPPGRLDSCPGDSLREQRREAAAPSPSAPTPKQRSDTPACSEDRREYWIACVDRVGGYCTRPSGPSPACVSGHQESK